MKNKSLRWLIAILFFAIYPVLLSAQDVISLSGRWRIALDGNFKDWPDKTGETQRWYKEELPLNEHLSLLNQVYFKNSPYGISNTINLPGSTDEAGIGSILQPSPVFTPGLERLFTYDGAFWVQREVEIPANWRGRKVILKMERIPGASKVFWNDRLAGSDYGYAYPHEITLDTSVAPGKHRLTILVNKDDYRYEQTGHQITSANGTSWNGIIGKIELKSVNPTASFKKIQVYPSVASGSIRIKLPVHGFSEDLKIRVRLSVFPPAADAAEVIEMVDLSSPDVSTTLNLIKPVKYWNEFSPQLYRLKCELLLDNETLDVQSVTFGMRELTTASGYFLVNGKRTVMRGTLDCGSFPMTGYPATGKEEWLRIMRTIKDYGLNMVRYHTWCPPEAAFEAADETGIYLQPELCGRPYTELQRVLETYGNHPSFCMLSLNNEAFSHNEETRELLDIARKSDPRHLYTCTSHPVSLTCTDDFYVSAWGSEKQDAWPFSKRIVGITWGGGDVVTSSRFNLAAPETYSDFRSEIAGISAPVLAHEMGQWAMFPDLSETEVYNKGVLRNTNYERIGRVIAERGLQPYTADMALASGRFSALLYKEEIESVMRTPSYGGFQLLGLNDYQGQYISIVGILNDLWKPKGLVEPSEHRNYCNAVVPLLRMKKRVFRPGETFSARLDVTNVSSAALNQVRPEWKLTDLQGRILKSGRLPVCNLPDTGLTTCGEISFRFDKSRKAAALRLSVQLPGTEYANWWNVWVFDEPVNQLVDSSIFITGSLEEATVWLSEGKKVLLSVNASNCLYLRDPCFTPVFWNSIHKWPQQAHTTGILCDPGHPVFRNFPTEMHSDWQWWDITMYARAMVLNDLPVALHPLVSVIDSYIVNDKLAYLWEVSAGSGKLLVSSVDFTTDMERRPASRQLYRSILGYMQSEDFNPVLQIGLDELPGVFKVKSGNP